MKSVNIQSVYIAVAMLMTSTLLAADEVDTQNSTPAFSNHDALVWSSNNVNRSKLSENTSSTVSWEVEALEPETKSTSALDRMFTVPSNTDDTASKNGHYTDISENVKEDANISSWILIVLATLGLANILGKKSKK